MSVTDDAQAQPPHPQVVASRYLKLMVAGRAHKKKSEALLTQLKEALGTIRYFGVREKNRAEELQLLDVERRGNTRRAPTSGRLHDLAAAGSALDASVRHWEDEVIGKCDALLSLTQERLASGDYHESFLDLSRALVDEVRLADWTAAPPRPSPWESIPTLFSPALLDAARATSCATSLKPSDGSFVVAAEWCGVAPREVLAEDGDGDEVNKAAADTLDGLGTTATAAAATPAVAALNSSTNSAPETSAARVVKALSVSCFAPSLAASSPSATFSDAATAARQHAGPASVRLNISCCCIDESEANLSALYLGTERGVIFAVPLEAMFPAPDEKKAGANRAIQASLHRLLYQRARLHEESASLTSMRRMFGSGGTFHSEFSGQVIDHAPATASSGTAGSQFFLQDGAVKMFRGHVVAVNSLFLISHRERGKLLVSTSADKTVRLFNAITGAVVGIIGPEQAVCSRGVGYLKGPDAIVTAHLDGSVKVWGVQSGELVRTILELPKCPIHSCHVLPDIQPAAGEAAVEGATSYTILLGCRNGHVYGIRVIVLPPRNAAAFTEELSPAAVQVSHVFLPDSAPGGLLSGSAAPVVRGGHTKAVLCMASVACFLFTGDAEGKVIKWDLHRQEKLLVFHQHIDDITALSCTSDGYLFTASRDGLWIVWNAENGNVVQRVGKHYHQVVGLVVGYREQQPEPATTTNASSPTDGIHNSSNNRLLSEPAGSSPQTSPASATGPSPSKAKRKKKANTNASSDTPFPMVPKALRMQPPGSREAVAVNGYQASETQEWVRPLVVSVSKDDSLVAWQWMPKID